MKPTPPTDPIHLTALPSGAWARLHVCELEAEDRALLCALGLSERCRFRLCSAREPWIVQVRTTRIGLAESVARRLWVVPEPAA